MPSRVEALGIGTDQTHRLLPIRSDLPSGRNKTHDTTEQASVRPMTVTRVKWNMTRGSGGMVSKASGSEMEPRAKPQKTSGSEGRAVRGLRERSRGWSGLREGRPGQSVSSGEPHRMRRTARASSRRQRIRPGCHLLSLCFQKFPLLAAQRWNTDNMGLVI